MTNNLELGLASERMAAVEEAIKNLDVPAPPAKSIDLTAYLLVASRKSTEGANLPSELQEVVKQLKGVLNYQGFRLLLIFAKYSDIPCL